MFSVRTIMSATRNQGVSGGDPYWAYVSLLINDNETNAASNATPIDSSSNNFTITRAGDASVSVFTPFSTGSAGSVYMDGTGDYLSMAYNSAFDISTGDFTIECWVYLAATGGTREIVAMTNASFNSWELRLNTSQNVLWVIGGTTRITSTATIAANTWTHIAVSRSSGTTTLYIAGTADGTTATAPNNNSVTVQVGRQQTNGYNWIGNIASLRLVKGTAVYTGNFTPSTSALTAIAGTSFLMNFSNAAIYDSRSAITAASIQTSGNAQVSTTQAKFGTTSIAFDGTGDWLKIADSTTQQFGTSQFTAECWVYISSGTGARGIIGKGAASTGWAISINASNQWIAAVGGSAISSGTTVTTGVWHHIALTRDGSNLCTLWLNGTSVGTPVTNSTDLNQTQNMAIGAARDLTGPIIGFIEQVRLTKGIARYAASFTPPTDVFPTN